MECHSSCVVSKHFFSPTFPMQMSTLRQEDTVHMGTCQHSTVWTGLNSCIFDLKDFDLIWILQSSSLRVTALKRSQKLFKTWLLICRPNIPPSTSPWPFNSHTGYDSCHRYKKGNHPRCRRVCFSILFFNNSTDGKLEALQDPNKSITKRLTQINLTKTENAVISYDPIHSYTQYRRTDTDANTLRYRKSSGSSTKACSCWWLLMHDKDHKAKCTICEVSKISQNSSRE